MPMILLLTKDLFFVPRIRAACTNQATELAVVLTIDSPKLDTLPPAGVSAWIIDLSGVPLAELPAVVESLGNRFPNAKRIAFGPHVQEQRLHAARAAGCQQVLTRGQLDSQLDRLMPDWIG